MRLMNTIQHFLTSDRNSSTTHREQRFSITLSLITLIFLKIWRPSSVSFITWCARCPEWPNNFSVSGFCAGSCSVTGLWSPRQQFGVNVPDEVCRLLASGGGAFWNANLSGDSGEAFEVVHYGQGATGEVVSRCAVEWALTGEHNVRNALAAIAAARHAGIDTATSTAALREFEGVKRRMEHLGTIGGVGL